MWNATQGLRRKNQLFGAYCAEGAGNNPYPDQGSYGYQPECSLLGVFRAKQAWPSGRTVSPALIEALGTYEGKWPPVEDPSRYYADARSLAAQALGNIGMQAETALPALKTTLKDESKNGAGSGKSRDSENRGALIFLSP